MLRQKIYSDNQMGIEKDRWSVVFHGIESSWNEYPKDKLG